MNIASRVCCRYYSEEAKQRAGSGMSSVAVDLALNEVDVAAVRNLPLFDGLEEQDLSLLIRSAAIQRHPSGTLLFEQDTRPHSLHVLIRGTVELFKSGRKGECGLMLLSPGDVFMPAAALFDEPYLNSARTLTQTRLLLLRAEIVRGEFTRCHRLAQNLCRALAGQFRMATRHIIDLKSRSAPQRLADFLLRIVDQSDAGGVADLPVPKRHLARRVGMSPETLSRTLQTLADNGLLVRGTKIIVRNRDKIERFCGPMPYPEGSETALDVHAL